VSPLRLMADILWRYLGPQSMPPLDYFDFRLFDPKLTEADRLAFVSEHEITRLNSALAPDPMLSLTGLIDSKILTELLLRGAGLPTSETVAVACSSPAPLPCQVLTGAEAVEHFLRQEGRLPLFGKPTGASLGVGAAVLARLEGDELVLGDGTRTPVRRFAAEVARDYPDGYLFQRIVVPHPKLAELIGPVIGTLRILSLRLKAGPAPLFAMLKMPGPGAMVDGALSGANAAAFVDTATGKILRAQLLTAPIGEDLTHGHVTNAPLTGAELPDYPQALALALDAHRLFPHQGVLGLDIMLSDRGPLINEINLNPLSSLVQQARGRGLFDESFKAKYREALAVNGVKLPVKGVRL